MMALRIRSLAVLALAAVLSACTLAPKYEQPAAPVASAYEGVDTAPANVAPAAEIGWKDFFPDPELRDLIGRALVNNRDLRIATLNVEAARAQYRIQQSDLVPSIEAEGSATNQLTPATLSLVSPTSASTSTTCDGFTPNFSSTPRSSNQVPSSRGS